MRRKMAISFLLVGMLLLSGCNKDIKITTGLSQEEIFRIAGKTESLSEMILVLINEKNRYEGYLGEDIWDRTFENISLEDEMKEKVKNQMVELTTVSLMAAQEKIKIGETEEEQLKLAAAEYYALLGEEQINKLQVTEKDVYHFYEKLYLTDKYYELKTGEEGMEISDEDAKVIEVMYLYFRTGNRDIYGNVNYYDETVLTETKQRAQDVLLRVSQGADFAVLAQTESDAEEYELTFGKGMMEESFENAAFGLSAGECSELVECEDGYYIIKCVSDYLQKETDENKKTMKDKYKAQKFKEIYVPFLEKQELEFNNKVWEKISFDEYTDCDTADLYQVYYSYLS